MEAPGENRLDVRPFDGRCHRSRRTLGQPAATRSTTLSAARASKSEEMPLYELLITLDGAHVQIDRRVLVPGQATLGDLHVVIQLAMGWQDCHLHAFTDRNGTTYGDSTMSGLDFAEQSRFRVSEVLAELGDEIEYDYDFGDSWHHRIELVQIRPDEGQGIRGLACIGGHGMCPPEDCGGIWSYAELCDALADPRHRDHEEMVEWVGEDHEQPFDPSLFDPSAFDLEAANTAVRTLLGRTRPGS